MSTDEGKRSKSLAKKVYLSTDKGKKLQSLSQKLYINSDKGMEKVINAQKSYFNSDKGKEKHNAAQKTYLNSVKGKGKLTDAQKIYFNSEKGKGRLTDAQKSYFNSSKGKEKLSAQKTYHSTSKGKRAMCTAQKTYYSRIKGSSKNRVYKSSTKGKIVLNKAKKSYYTTVKGIQNKHTMNKQYYDSFCSKECLESNSIKHLAYSKRALDRIVSQESSRSALVSSSNKGIDCTPLLSDIGSCNNDEHYNVKNSLDNSITNHNSSNVLLSIREHKASAAVTKHFNKDKAKKFGANRKTVNPPLSIIAPNESCQSIFKNLHYQPVNHIKSQALVKFIFHAKSYLKSEFFTMTNAQIAGKSSEICPNFALDKATKDANVDYILDRLILDYLHVRERWVTNLAYYAYQTKQLASDIFDKLELADDKGTAGIVLGKLAHTKNFVPFSLSIVLKMVSNMTLQKEIALLRMSANRTLKLILKISRIPMMF